MIIQTKLEFKDYLRLIFATTFRKPLVIIITIIGAGTLLASVLYYLGIDIPADDSLPWITRLILGLAFTVLVPLSIYRSARKNYFSHPTLQETAEYEFSANSIKIKGESYTSEIDWSKIYRVKEISNFILIYHNIQIAYIIPKHSFGGKLADFKNLVKSLNVKSKFRN